MPTYGSVIRLQGECTDCRYGLKELQGRNSTMSTVSATLSKSAFRGVTKSLPTDALAYISDQVSDKQGMQESARSCRRYAGITFKTRTGRINPSECGGSRQAAHVYIENNIGRTDRLISRFGFDSLSPLHTKPRNRLVFGVFVKCLYRVSHAFRFVYLPHEVYPKHPPPKDYPYSHQGYL